MCNERFLFFISGTARTDIHRQGCGNQAGVRVWTQLQPQAGPAPVIQHEDFTSITLKPAEVKDYLLLGTQPRQMLRPVWTLTKRQWSRDKRGDQAGERDPGDLIYCRWFDPAQPPIRAWPWTSRFPFLCLFFQPSFICPSHIGCKLFTSDMSAQCREPRGPDLTGDL